ncbi:MAG: KH domain-containing protein [Actinomycetota bacterium]|nr:KH domain-containing protein [Actinomycetota bacterium]
MGEADEGGEATVPERVLQFVAEQLVDHPDGVSVTAVEEDDHVTTLELRVHPEDLGKVIGKRGRTAKALRTLVKSTMEGDQNVNVEIVD